MAKPIGLTQKDRSEGSETDPGFQASTAAHTSFDLRAEGKLGSPEGDGQRQCDRGYACAQPDEGVRRK